MFGEGGLAIPCHFAAAAAFFPPPRNSELRKRRLRSLAGLGWDSSVCVYGWNPKRRRGRRRSFSLSPPPFFAAAEEEKLAAMNQDDIGRRHRRTYNFTAARTHKKPFSFSFSCPHRLSQTLKSIAYRLREKNITLSNWLKDSHIYF